MSNETDRLRELEAGFRRDFVAAGLALDEIRRDRLYKVSGYSTFEQYCTERWGFTQQYATSLCRSAKAVETMVSLGLPAPEKERHARELAKLPADQRAPVWEAALEATDGEPTSSAVAHMAEHSADPEAAIATWRRDHPPKEPKNTAKGRTASARMWIGNFRKDAQKVLDRVSEGIEPDARDEMRAEINAIRELLNQIEGELA